jgi:antitoxin component YwqK of YwqJK toxin-antitoxin module
MRIVLLYFLLLLCNSLNTIAQNKTEINQLDESGKPHGLWYTYTPAERGEAAESKFGHYDHGDKMGLWYVNDGKGNMISIETFKFNVRDGEAKYFENGQLTCIGHYRGLNPKVALDTVLIVDPITGDEKWVSVPTERGSVRHGSWRFYDELSGRLIKEEQYQIDELIYKKDFSISSSDSAFYQKRNAILPHKGNKLPPSSKFKSKEPAKSLIGG